jgi:7,8-dihydroneopterin aldolase/epimerase/oxygenase
MKILIEDLHFEAILGILPHERLTPQTVRIDCSIEYVYTEEKFINYAEVTNHIEKIMRLKQFRLIEEALESLAASLKNSFPLIDALSLTIRKPDILQNCTVGVQNHFVF